MPFTAITGSFRLVSKTTGGQVVRLLPRWQLGLVRLPPDYAQLLDPLTVIDRPIGPTSIGSVQLRTEGIDAHELHFQSQMKGAKSTHRPPLIHDARDVFAETTNPPARLVCVKERRRPN